MSSSSSSSPAADASASADALSRGGPRALALGQLIALLIAATGVFSSLLVERGAAFPALQSLTLYLALALAYVPLRLLRSGTRPLRADWWRYALLAACDVEANFAVVLAYQHTSLTSVMLLDCLTIPFVMLLSRRWLGAAYSTQHFAGVAACVAGVALLVAADAAGGEAAGPPGGNAAFGDFLCIVAALLYAVSNVGQELFVRRLDRVEFLAAIGAFGAALSAAQFAALEARSVAAVWPLAPDAQGLLAGFVLSLLAMYSVTSLFLQHCGDATLFNLSLLSADLWAILASVLLFGERGLSPYYFASLALTVGGVVAYNRAPVAAPAVHVVGGREGGGLASRDEGAEAEGGGRHETLAEG